MLRCTSLTLENPVLISGIAIGLNIDSTNVSFG